MRQGQSRRRFTKEFKIEAVQLTRQPGMTVKRVAAIRELWAEIAELRLDRTGETDGP